MRRREFIAGLGSAATCALMAAAQQNKVWRIGMLDTAPQELQEGLSPLRIRPV
jgi:hypothetical protein